MSKIKSECCDANIVIDGGGVGVFALTTGSYTCEKCKKYCAAIEYIDDPHCRCDRCREKRTVTLPLRECTRCAKPATQQTAKGKYAEERGRLPQNHGYYCDKCWKEGLELEMEAMYG